MRVQLAESTLAPQSLAADGFNDLDALKDAIRVALSPALDGKDFWITNSSYGEIGRDEDVQKLVPDSTLYVLSMASSTPRRERISFQPHPKTLTMAGELEYWAAEGHSPLPYALAELIDNGLKATQYNTLSKKVVITIVLSGGSKPQSGLISVWDNGCGMESKELCDWAVMNYSMEDRGHQPQERHPGRGPAQRNQTDRFLSGDLSYFGVGSKNAAFFMGRRIKIATRSVDSSLVHELGIAAADLEQRYKDQQDVYVEDLVHREPADDSTMSSMEKAFEGLAAQWVKAEACIGSEACPDLMPNHVEAQEAGSSGNGSSSFTRVMIGDVKKEWLSQVAQDVDGQKICRDIKHLYHYYLHGASGRQSGQNGQAAERGAVLPEIILQCAKNNNLVWRRSLVDICDDMESKYLEAQKREMRFSLRVPGKGIVTGVLYYFPFEQERETVPMDARQTHHGAPGGAQPAAAHERQSPDPEPIDLTEDDSSLQQLFKAPIFSAFWQGRLVAGARIDSLPFIEEARPKKGQALRKKLPDEVFLRLRGSLFFGPEFRVTRNKLSFRDNLQELLATANPGERSANLQQTFQEWIMKCHTDVDKKICFKDKAEPSVQAAVKAAVGEEATVFEQISDGSRSFRKGEIVRVKHKNKGAATVGLIQHFYVQKVVEKEGIYADGMVTLQPLPEEMHGYETRDVLLRQLLEGQKLSQSAAAEHRDKELLKMPARLQVADNPWFAAGRWKIPAGDRLPETLVLVLNGNEKKITQCQMAGKKENLRIVQSLWRLATASGSASSDTYDAENMDSEEGSCSTKRRRRNPRRGAAAATAVAKLSEDVNVKLYQGDFWFKLNTLQSLLGTVGQYRLGYKMLPAVPGKEPLSISTIIQITPGPAKSFKIMGNGIDVMAVCGYMLGEHLPDIQIILQDEFGNRVKAQEGQCDSLKLKVTGTAEENDDPVQIQKLWADGQSRVEDSCIIVSGARIMPVDRESRLDISQGKATPSSSSLEAQQLPAEPGSLTAAVAMVNVCVELEDFIPVQQPVKLRPGPPVQLILNNGHPFENLVDAKGGAELSPGAACPLMARMVSGDTLGFSIQAYDCCLQRSGSCETLECSLQVTCEQLNPSRASFPINAAGVAVVEGLEATYTAMTGTGMILLSLDRVPTSAGAEAALAFAGPGQEISIGIEVQPNTEPASLILLHNGEPIPLKPLDDDDDSNEDIVFLLEDVPAGSKLDGLGVQLHDVSGRPVPAGTEGRLRASWTRSGTDMKFNDDSGRCALPPLKVNNSVDRQDNDIVGFVLNGWARGKLLRVHLITLKKAGDPAVWHLRHGGPDAQDAKGGNLSERCGVSFPVLVEAHDKFGNRCKGRSALAYSKPGLIVDAEQELRCDPESWGYRWIEQEGFDVCECTVVLIGRPGLVTLHARDYEGVHDSELRPAYLEINLSAGPVACLEFEKTQLLQYGLRDCIEALRLHAIDCFGNRTSCAPFEVVLEASALANGSRAAATIAGRRDNRTKLKDGEALFKSVRIEAEAPGVYTLRANYAAGEVAGRATIDVELQARNGVTSISVVGNSLPADGVTAGTNTVICIQVETGDEQPLDTAAAEQGLMLRLMPAGGGAAEEITTDTILPGSSRPEEGMYAYETNILKLAGEYAVTAEFTETRPELMRLLTRRTSTLRSPPAAFHVLAGPPAELELVSDTDSEDLTVTNGSEAQSCLLLSRARLQLVDKYGNPSPTPGQSVRISLQWPAETQVPAGSILPDLELEDAVVETDDGGSASFGDIRIREGSGQVSKESQQPGKTPGTMEFLLIAEVAVTSGEAAWLAPYFPTISSLHRTRALAWSCPVAFSDNAATAAAIRELTRRKGAHVACRNELRERSAKHKKACQDAHKDVAAARILAAAAKRKFHCNAPDSCTAARDALARICQERATVLTPHEPIDARIGEPNDGMTLALRNCMAMNDPDVFGCLASLCTIQDGNVNRLLSTLSRSDMQLLVVKSDAATARVKQHLQKRRGRDRPNILALTQALAFNSQEGDVPGFASSGQRAQDLTQQACKGSDPPLAIQLPHTRAIRGRTGLARHGLCPEDWPDGCINYAVNLVRPVQRGFRKKILYPMLLDGLVFETLDTAKVYRRFVTQVLKAKCPQIMTLDLGQITSRGVEMGSSLRFDPLASMHKRFGSGAAADAPAALAAADEEANMRSLMEALKQKEEAEAREVRAREEAEKDNLPDSRKMIDLEEQILAIDAQLPAQQQAAGERRGRKRKGRNRDEAHADSNAAAADTAAEPDRTKCRR